MFSNLLVQALPSYAPGVDPQLVLNTGATEIQNIFTGETLYSVRRAYMVGVKGAFTLGLAGSVASVLVSLLIPNKRLPLPSRGKDEQSDSEGKPS